MSTSVSARASTKGWYMEALDCRRMMGRCANKVGISAMVERPDQTYALTEHAISLWPCPSRYRTKDVQEDDTGTREEC